MIKRTNIDEAMLHAYVDAELDLHAVAEVEAWLLDNPADRVRVAHWQRQSVEMKRMFDPVLEEPLPQTWTNILNEKKPSADWIRWSRQAIAASLLIAFGAMGGWFLGPNEQPDIPEVATFFTQAMGAHTVFAADMGRPVEVGVDQKALLVTWLSNRLGQSLDVPDFSSTGFKLMGGRLLADDGQPAAQFMYENDDGERISLYIAGNPGGEQTEFRIVTADATESFYWLDGPLGFAITGNSGQGDLLRVAQIAFEQLSS